MKKEPKRAHSKVSQLPKEIREIIDRKILDGATYQEIADHLSALNHSISRSSVNRYGQRFIAKMEKLKLLQGQAAVIAEQTGDRPALEIVEATSQMALQVIMEHVMEMDSLKGAKATEVFKALALLERSAVQREKLKLDVKKKADEAVKNIEAKAKTAASSIDAETLTFIREAIYGITS